MKNKVSTILFVIFALIAVIGLFMRISSGTPYLNCLHWISDLEYVDGHLFAMNNIESCAKAYWGSIILLACGIEGLALTAVFTILSKKSNIKSADEV